jgi:glycosyltransferase involved in cell wall biosynthesis
MNSSFSIITPNYNMGNYLEETIESVLCNLQKGDEYFVIDGGSTDNSVEIICKYEKYLTGWISEPDKGYAHAISKGFNKSTNPLQCWINSGDLLLRGSLGRARAELTEMNVDMIFGDNIYIDEEGRVINHSSGFIHSLRKMMLYGGWTPRQEACFWRRSFYKRINGIDPTIQYAADYDLFLRMSILGSCEYVPIIFSAFRRHKGQKSIVGSLYCKERRFLRKRALSNEKICITKQKLAILTYYFKVRWLIHISAHLYKPLIPSGISASKLEALKIKKRKLF